MQPQQDSPDQAGAAIKYEVRHYDLSGEQARTIFPLVTAAIDAVGRGSVVLTDRGIQVTAPSELLLNLAATITLYKTNLTQIKANKIYLPIIDIHHCAADISSLVDQLGLCPPEMRCVPFSVSPHRSGIAVAGPEDREIYYRTKVMPNLRALVALVCQHPRESDKSPQE